MRRVLNADGTPFDARQYRTGDPVVVRWAIPLSVSASVRALAGVVDRGCAARMAVPGHWELRPDGISAAADGEAWMVSRSVVAPRASGRVLGYTAGLDLQQRLGLAATYDIGWVLLTPGPGKYVLLLTWDGVATADLAAASPCIAGWTDVPLDLAIAITLPPEGVRGRRQTGQGRPEPGQDSSFQGGATRAASLGSSGGRWVQGAVSLGAPADGLTLREAGRGSGREAGASTGGSSGTPSAPAAGGSRGITGLSAGRESSLAGHPALREPLGDSGAAARPSAFGTSQSQRAVETSRADADAAQAVSRALRLIGDPEFDLMRLHQAAINIEFTRVSAGSSAQEIDPVYRAAYRSLRADRLRLLDAASPAARARLCTAGLRQGLLDRRLWLWEDAPTLPPNALAGCRTS